MTLNEIIQTAVWAIVLGCIFYAHLSYRKLKKIIFNDLRHLLAKEGFGEQVKEKIQTRCSDNANAT